MCEVMDCSLKEEISNMSTVKRVASGETGFVLALLWTTGPSLAEPGCPADA